VDIDPKHYSQSSLGEQDADVLVSLGKPLSLIVALIVIRPTRELAASVLLVTALCINQQLAGSCIMSQVKSLSREATPGSTN
jgi:hypothetical protein